MTTPDGPAMPIRRHLLIALALACGAAGAQAQAQAAFPARPVTMVVPYAAGGVTDRLARNIAKALSERWGQTVLVDNKPGGGTVIGTAQAARAPADGHTLLLTSFGFIANQVMLPSLPYAPQSLAPLALVGDAPGVLFVHPSVPANNVAEFARWLRERSTPAAFASSGNGSSVHVMAELFASAVGVPITHVPYKGNAPGLNDLIGGQVQAMFDSPGAMGHVKAGRLKALGVTSATRSVLVPELPTIAEQGEKALASFTASSWFGFFVPAATPQPLQDRLHADLRAVLDTAAMQEETVRSGVEPKPMTQAAFAAYLKNQLDTWGPVIRAKNIKPD